MRPRTAAERQRGAALLLVLWTALLLSVVMAGAMAGARIEAKIAAARAEQFKAKESLRSALELAAWRLTVGISDPADEGPVVDHFALNGYDLTVERSIEGEKIDLNLASEDVWRGFLVAAGEKPDLANRLAAEIADWRDTDDNARPNGAEAKDYALARTKRIGNRPFAGVSELNDVLSMTPALYDCLAPAVTIFGAGEAPSARALTLIGANSA
ncbi:MAG TPA: hypothetical protein VNH64_03080, partial [Parvularculaceae bacterium]|nr:hypothetical protein [Parvularculaceae bacterium]